MPAKPGGGFELTCKLAQARSMEAGHRRADAHHLHARRHRGAWPTTPSPRSDRTAPDTLVAFSGGSLLNLAQGKFGRHDESDVRWLAAVGADYGAVVVAESSPFRTLKDVLAALKADPAKVVFGAGGTLGSQDWMKAALTRAPPA